MKRPGAPRGVIGKNKEPFEDESPAHGLCLGSVRNEECDELRSQRSPLDQYSDDPVRRCHIDRTQRWQEQLHDAMWALIILALFGLWYWWVLA